MIFILWTLAALAYCLIGALFLVAYILAMDPAKQSTILGLIMIGWPIMLIVEAVLIIAKGFGQIGLSMSARITNLKNKAA